MATATIFQLLSWSRNQHNFGSGSSQKYSVQYLFDILIKKITKFQGRNLLPAMPAAGSLPARTRRNVTPKSMSSQSHARCARPTPRPARGPVATAARPSDNRARDGRWPSGASAGGPRNRPMPQVYASCSLRRRGSIFSPPVYIDNTVPYQSVLNARHIHVERERERSTDRLSPRACAMIPRIPLFYIYTCILPKKRKQNIRSRGHRSLPVLSLSLPRAQVFSFKQHAKDLEGGLISSGFNHGTFQIKIYVCF